MKKVNVAILGLGTVGGGTYEILTDNHDWIAETQGVDVYVKRILDRDRERVAARASLDLLANSIDEIVSDPEIDIVVETMGGVEPAKTFIEKALTAGKHVVTANKELLAKCWHELEPVAKAHGAGLFFEASCVGGVPIIRTLTESMQANRICSLYGIINGTTNYILTEMTEEGISYETALRQAQQLGYAEFNPSADVDGYDAMYKLGILSSLAFHTSIPYTKIYREGISRITAEDIRSAAQLGYVVKLLAIGKRAGNAIEVRVHPTFVPKDHPLAAVSGAFNAVMLTGDFVDDIMLYGRGAGARPTGSAIVSDIVYCARQGAFYTDFGVSDTLSPNISVAEDFESKYYMALTAVDRAGVLASIGGVLGAHGVSIGTILQREGSGGYAQIVLLTHEASEKAVKAAIGEVEKLATVRSIDSLIRCL